MRELVGVADDADPGNRAAVASSGTASPFARYDTV
jgi:hypothetical protein